MYASTLISVLLYTSAISSRAAALPSPSSDSKQPMAPTLEMNAIPERLSLMGLQSADSVATIDLTGAVPGDHALVPRTPLDICVKDSGRAGVCASIAGIVTTIGVAIGTSAKGSSNDGCKVHSGAIDDVHWRVYATGKNGKQTNCGTTAQVTTIAGAIDAYLRDVDKDVCGVHCLRMTHGGTWAGYVSLAPAGLPVDNYYCGPAYSFGNCVHGGKKDAHE